tara:strand:+ start:554 stop:679 length:126 start_codon:yes stop_codon:yes gene_type:complete
LGAIITAGFLGYHVFYKGIKRLKEEKRNIDIRKSLDDEIDK